MDQVPVIVSTNYKGGVGKTTTSRVLAQTLAELDSFTKGKPILVIDLDPQGNTSRRWNLMVYTEAGTSVPRPHPELAEEDSNSSSVCDLWLDLLGLADIGLLPVPYVTSNPMIHVVPANEDLMFEAISLPRDQRHKLGESMRIWLRAKNMAETYSCVIIDTQPSKTPLIDAALFAATHVYIPFIPEPQAVEGVYAIISYVYTQSQQRSGDAPLTILGLLPNMVQKTKLHSLHLRTLEKHKTFSKYLMPVKLSRRIGYSETDDWRNTPEKVTDLEGSDIEFEAMKFAKYIAGRLTDNKKEARNGV